MVEPSNSHLPRLLCLHGGGTSAMIFKIQTRRLQWSLRQHFRFVFVDAPFESAAGPGVLPVFENCGPYHRWFILGSSTPERDQQRVRQVLRKAIADDPGDGEFVGVMGFSQGGRMAAGLLADQEEGEATGLPYWQFAVLLCASYPPLSMSNERARKEPKGVVDEHGEISEPEEREIISIPSVHVRGTLDPHREKGRRLAKYFNRETSVSMEFVMGHHLPGAAGDSTSSKGDTDAIRDAILRAFAGDLKAGGDKGAGANGTRSAQITV
ncbi:hypothetical protein ABVK25_009122 [Lepraria finkii]|uniref:Serine hydrolase domain-containing protein n=1 Tax=Lepraria finkii TaxID=1340010 RepID=A0ABR4B151_9LECA